MPAIEAPLTVAASNAELDDSQLNPDITNNDSIVHLTLKFEGVSVNPDNIYDMVDAQYGTVYSEKGAGGNTTGCYIFKITP